MGGVCQREQCMEKGGGLRKRGKNAMPLSWLNKNLGIRGTFHGRTTEHRITVSDGKSEKKYVERKKKKKKGEKNESAFAGL